MILKRNHNNFKINLKFAQKGEKLVVEYLKNIFPNLILLHYNDSKSHDIFTIINNKPVTFEVKEDVRCKDTNNVVIETESWNRPSGLNTSMADYWVFRLHRPKEIEHYLIKLDKLKYVLFVLKKYFKIEK